MDRKRKKARKKHRSVPKKSSRIRNLCKRVTAILRKAIPGTSRRSWDRSKLWRMKGKSESCLYRSRHMYEYAPEPPDEPKISIWWRKVPQKRLVNVRGVSQALQRSLSENDVGFVSLNPLNVFDAELAKLKKSNSDDEGVYDDATVTYDPHQLVSSETQESLISSIMKMIECNKNLANYHYKLMDYGLNKDKGVGKNLDFSILRGAELKALSELMIAVRSLSGGYAVEPGLVCLNRKLIGSTDNEAEYLVDKYTPLEDFIKQANDPKTTEADIFRILHSLEVSDWIHERIFDEKVKKLFLFRHVILKRILSIEKCLKQISAILERNQALKYNERLDRTKERICKVLLELNCWEASQVENFGQSSGDPGPSFNDNERSENDTGPSARDAGPSSSDDEGPGLRDAKSRQDERSSSSTSSSEERRRVCIGHVQVHQNPSVSANKKPGTGINVPAIISRSKRKWRNFAGKCQLSRSEKAKPISRSEKAEPISRSQDADISSSTNSKDAGEPGTSEDAESSVLESKGTSSQEDAEPSNLENLQRARMLENVQKRLMGFLLLRSDVEPVIDFVSNLSHAEVKPVRKLTVKSSAKPTDEHQYFYKKSKFGLTPCRLYIPSVDFNAAPDGFQQVLLVRQRLFSHDLINRSGRGSILAEIVASAAFGSAEIYNFLLRNSTECSAASAFSGVPIMGDCYSMLVHVPLTEYNPIEGCRESLSLASGDKTPPGMVGQSPHQPIQNHPKLLNLDLGVVMSTTLSHKQFGSMEWPFVTLPQILEIEGELDLRKIKYEDRRIFVEDGTGWPWELADAVEPRAPLDRFLIISEHRRIRHQNGQWKTFYIRGEARFQPSAGEGSRSDTRCTPRILVVEDRFVSSVEGQIQTLPPDDLSFNDELPMPLLTQKLIRRCDGTYTMHDCSAKKLLQGPVEGAGPSDAPYAPPSPKGDKAKAGKGKGLKSGKPYFIKKSTGK